MSGADDQRGAEDARMVEEALHCAETGDAGHWPTAAGFLAGEVYRLRAELAEQYRAAESDHAASRNLREYSERLERELDETRALVPPLYWLGDEMPEGAIYDGYFGSDLDEPTINGNRRPYLVITPAQYSAIVKAAQEER